MYRKLYLVGGFPGSGKSEFSKRLADRLNFVVFNKDPLTRPLVEALCQAYTGNPNDRESPAYVKDVRPLEYETIMGVAWDNLDRGNNVVCDAPFTMEFRDRNWLEDLKQRCIDEDVILKKLWVRSDLDLMFKRIVSRGAPRDEWKSNNWAEYSRQIKSYPVPQVDWVINNNHKNLSLLTLEIDRLLTEEEEFDEIKIQIERSKNLNKLRLPRHLIDPNPNPTKMDIMEPVLPDPYSIEDDIIADKVDPSEVYRTDGTTYDTPQSALEDIKTPEEVEAERIIDNLD